MCRDFIIACLKQVVVAKLHIVTSSKDAYTARAGTTAPLLPIHDIVFFLIVAAMYSTLITRIP